MPETAGRSPIASRLAAFGESVFTPFSRLAREHEAVNLGQGFPDFDGPEVVKEAAIRAIRDGHNQYAPPYGVPALQEAIAAWTTMEPGSAPVDPAAMVTVTNGCTEALPATMLGLLEPGDEVIALEPWYDAYPAAASMAGARIRGVRLHPPDFDLDVAELRAAVTPRTRAILVNTPHNPTGTVLGRARLEAIAELCRAHELVCITDEVYERLVFEGAHVRMRDLDGMAGRTVTCSSLGKTFSFTGWKIGWTVAPPPLAEAIRAAHQYLSFAVATPFQHAAAVALGLGDDYFDAYLERYRTRRDRLVAGLADVGFGVRPPQGTYFTTADISPFAADDEDDVAFCRRLVTEVGVAAIPTSAFHADPADGRRHVRFAFCKDEATIDAAIDRLRRGLTPGAPGGR